MRKRLMMLVVVMVVLLSVNVALAMDIMPPEYRGLPDSTFQVWEFMEPDPFPLAGIPGNPYGPAEAVIVEGVWDPGVYGLEMGLWVDTLMEFHVPNTLNQAPDSWKDLRIQVTLIDTLGMGLPIFPPFVDVFGDFGEFAFPLYEELVPVDPFTWVFIQDWHIEPNPIMEHILVDAIIAGPGIGVSEVVIDTICVPEPTAMMLLGLGGLVVRIRRA
jgi:hypothetical protein